METLICIDASRLFYNVHDNLELPDVSISQYDRCRIVGTTGLMQAVLIDHRYDLEKAIRGVGHMRARINREVGKNWKKAINADTYRITFDVFAGLKFLRAQKINVRKFCGQNPWRESRGAGSIPARTPLTAGGLSGIRR